MSEAENQESVETVKMWGMAAVPYIVVAKSPILW